MKNNSQKARPTGKTAETHQTTADRENSLATNQGVILADDQNSLKAGTRGPML
jgi:catalase